MTFRQFAALAAVARHMNITKAAQELRTSQPSLSKHLKSLEDAYKLKLFTRSGKGIQLTEEGREFLTYVERILDQVKALEDRFSTKPHRHLSSPLRVGASYALAASFVPPLLGIFGKRYPNVEVVLRCNGTDILEKMLMNGAVELVLTSVKSQSADLIVEPCMKLRLVAFAAKGLALPPGKELSLKQLEKIPLIIRNSGTSRGTTETLVKKLLKQGYKNKILMRCESPDAIRTAVSRKLGIGILYEDLVKDGIARGLFKRVNVRELPQESTAYLLFHRSRALSPTAQAFHDMVRERCTIRHNDWPNRVKGIPAEVSREAVVAEEEAL